MSVRVLTYYEIVKKIYMLLVHSIDIGTYLRYASTRIDQRAYSNNHTF